MICCVLGFCSDFYYKKIPFLEENKNNILVFLDTEPTPVESFSYPGVYFFSVRSFFDVSLISIKVASLAVLLKIEIIEIKKDAVLQLAASEIVAKQQHLNLEFMDVLDFGVQKYKNAIENLKIPYQKFSHLINAFKDVPAIIVGAGPSLESIAKDLQSYRSRALIFSGGKALEKISFAPHFSVIIDPQETLKNLCNVPSTVCFQSRVNSESLAKFSSHRLQIPEGHLPFLNALTNDLQLSDCGWTCGNVQVLLSILLGCNPIITCGMDFCFLEDKKYAFDRKHTTDSGVNVVNRKGQQVMTQQDWILAVAWMQKIEKQYPDRKFFNLSEEGMDFFSPAKITDFSFPLNVDYDQKIHSLLEKAPWQGDCFVSLWKQKLGNAQQLLHTAIEGNCEVTEKLLMPLWLLWQPIIEREFLRKSKDPQLEMQAHKIAFFMQVLKAHLEV